MPYSDMATEEQIVLAAEFVGRGVPVPQEIQKALGPALLRDITHPEFDNEPTEHGRSRTGRAPATPHRGLCPAETDDA